jgi:hypothetical protein
MGAANPIPAVAPFRPFFFAFLLQSQSFSHQTLFIPQSQHLGAATPHRKRAHHIGEHHCTQPPYPHRKKKLGISPSPSCRLPPQTKLNNSSQQPQQQSWLPLVTVTVIVEFHHQSRSSSSVVSFSAI